MTMALIPAGDDPQGRYTLTNDFYMMTTEVTQAMFLRFMTYVHTSVVYSVQARTIHCMEALVTTNRYPKYESEHKILPTR